MIQETTAQEVYQAMRMTLQEMSPEIQHEYPLADTWEALSADKKSLFERMAKKIRTVTTQWAHMTDAEKALIIRIMQDDYVPLEAEMHFLPAMLTDDGANHSPVPLTDEQVDALLLEGRIYYCKLCQRDALLAGQMWREYHTSRCPEEIEDYEAYVQELLNTLPE